MGVRKREREKKRKKKGNNAEKAYEYVFLDGKRFMDGERNTDLTG